MPGLRVIRARHAAREHLGGHRRGIDLRAGQLLQPRDPADMVVVLVALEDDLHVAEPESELADIGRDQVGARLGPAVDQDMALRSR